jgi:hypothetical protein
MKKLLQAGLISYDQWRTTGNRGALGPNIPRPLNSLLLHAMLPVFTAVPAPNPPFSFSTSPDDRQRPTGEKQA